MYMFVTFTDLVKATLKPTGLLHGYLELNRLGLARVNLNNHKFVMIDFSLDIRSSLSQVPCPPNLRNKNQIKCLAYKGFFKVDQWQNNDGIHLVKISYWRFCTIFSKVN